MKSSILKLFLNVIHKTNTKGTQKHCQNIVYVSKTCMMGAAKIQMKFVHASVNPTTALFGDEPLQLFEVIEVC